jgi:predicted RNA binding protein YcfA (HicA-like mRNA interferase family)
LLSRHGFVEVRRRGSHVVMQKRTADSSITVPVPDHKELRIGTMMSIIRQSGLPREVFETT